jgi:hypothetical protein
MSRKGGCHVEEKELPVEELCDVRWYTFSWNDVLRLPMPEEVRRTEVEVFIDREAETFRYWGEREPQVLGIFGWDWVREDLRIAEWRLGDWFTIFRDLRIFFYVHQTGGGVSSIHILAVQEAGGDYRAGRSEELLARREAVLALLGDEPEPKPPVPQS